MDYSDYLASQFLSHIQGTGRFNFFSQDWFDDYLSFCQDQMNPWNKADLIEEFRNTLLNCENYNLGNENQIYIHSLDIRTPTLLTDKQFENYLLNSYPSLFDEDIGQNFLLFLVGIFLISLLLQFKR